MAWSSWSHPSLLHQDPPSLIELDRSAADRAQLCSQQSRFMLICLSLEGQYDLELEQADL